MSPINTKWLTLKYFNMDPNVVSFLNHHLFTVYKQVNFPARCQFSDFRQSIHVRLKTVAQKGLKWVFHTFGYRVFIICPILIRFFFLLRILINPFLHLDASPFFKHPHPFPRLLETFNHGLEATVGLFCIWRLRLKK